MNSNRPLATNPGFILYKFENVQGERGAGLCTMRSKLKKFEHVRGRGVPQRQGLVWWGRTGGPYRVLPVDRQTDTTENIPFQQFRWWAVTIGSWSFQLYILLPRNSASAKSKEINSVRSIC